MAVTTISYSPAIQGFPSRYSFEPDMMISMNNRFYSFSGDGLYQHHSDNVDRLEFYGAQYDAEITFVFNDSPLERKVFKTIGLEGNDAWNATMTADSGQTGTITDTFFEEKETEYFAFIRFNTGSTNFRTRNVGGIGEPDAVNTSGTELTLTYNGGYNNLLNIGDELYYFDPLVPPSGDEILIGTVTAKTATTIVVDPYSSAPAAFGEPVFYVKNSQAESYGLLGSFIEVRLTNNSTTQVELFAAQSEVMKSFP